jgi:hypothetical protein
VSAAADLENLWVDASVGNAALQQQHAQLKEEQQTVAVVQRK